MAATLSPELMQSMKSVELFEQMMAKLYQAYKQGDRAALLTAIILCADFHQAMPDWLVRELINLESAIDRQLYPDLNAFFQFKRTHVAKARLHKKIKASEKIVLDALFRHRIAGGNFTTGEGIEAVAESIGLPRRVVEAIYKQNADWLKNVNSKDGVTQGYARITLPAFD
jgi:hypothetical protein